MLQLSLIASPTGDGPTQAGQGEDIPPAQSRPEGKFSAGLGSRAASWPGHSFGTDWTVPRAVAQHSSDRGGLRQEFRHLAEGFNPFWGASFMDHNSYRHVPFPVCWFLC